jgi:hypothetical protein
MIDLDALAFLDLDIYGYGQIAQIKIADAPPPPTISGVPQPLVPGYMFWGVGMPDGNALISWVGDDGGNHTQFVSGFDLRETLGTGSGPLLSGVASVEIGSPDPEYSMFLMISAGTETLTSQPALSSVAAPASEQATLAKLSTQLDPVRAGLLAPSGGTGSDPPAVHQFDDLGHPPGEFFRVLRFKRDSDGDGVWDNDEFAIGADPFDIDSDNNLVLDAFQNADTDGDGFPNSDPANPQPIISEILSKNDGSFIDGDGNASDWLELYNPSSTAIPLTGWRLTDKGDGNPIPWKYTFPPGTPDLGPNSFLIMVASGTPGNYVDPLGFRHVDFKIMPGDQVALGKPATANDPTPVVDRHDIADLPRSDISCGWAPDTEEATPGGVAVGLAKPRYFAVLSLVLDFPGSAGVAVGLAKPRYFAEPTPGTPSATVSYLGVCDSLTFTLPGGVFDAANLTNPDGALSVSIIPQTVGDHIYYTTNCAAPSGRSLIARAPLILDETTVVRAIAGRRRFIPSKPITHSYLFKHSTLGQVRPEGYPDANADEVGGTVQTTIDYEMDPGVVALDSAMIASGLDAPSVSIVVPVADLFNRDTHGLYANSRKTYGVGGGPGGEADPTGQDWEREGSFEYFDPTGGTGGSPLYAFDNAIVEINGGASRRKQVSDKTNLRVSFKKRVSFEDNGKLEFGNPPLPGSNQALFDTLILRQGTFDSWARNEPALTAFRQHATYVRESFGRELHRRMGITPGNFDGHLIAHFRWLNLYLNGLYWGAYQLTERVDEDFLQAYIFDDRDYDIRTNEGVKAGDAVAWDDLITKCQEAHDDAEAAAQNGTGLDPEIYPAVTARLDMDNYIDYMIVNLFMVNADWGTNNFRVVRRRPSDEEIQQAIEVDDRWRCLTWDMDHSMASGSQGNPIPNLTGGIAEPYALLLEHPDFQADFQARVAVHFGDGGVLGPVNAGTNPGSVLFQQVANEFDAFGPAESARWGDCVEATDYRYDDPAITGSAGGDWLSSIAYRVGTWIPERRVHFVRALYAEGLADPANHPDIPPTP